MKKIKLQHPTDRLLIFIIVALLGLLVAVLWFFGQRINILWDQNGNNVNAQKADNNSALVGTDTKFYIQAALKSLYSYQTVTDPIQKRVYFPEGKFYVPQNTTSRKLVYAYVPASNAGPEQVMITANGNLNLLAGTFADVSCLQRHVTVNIDSKDSPDGTLAGSKKLEDGRTIYIYQHQDGDCSDLRWSFYSAADITSLLEQAHSY